MLFLGHWINLRGNDPDGSGEGPRKDVTHPSASDFHHHVSRLSYRSRKPYPAWIDSLPFPLGYGMPKFFMFNALGNPEQANSLSRCGETSKNGALRQLHLFVQSLEGDAFV